MAKIVSVYSDFKRWYEEGGPNAAAVKTYNYEVGTIEAWQVRMRLARLLLP